LSDFVADLAEKPGELLFGHSTFLELPTDRFQNLVEWSRSLQRGSRVSSIITHDILFHMYR